MVIHIRNGLMTSPLIFSVFKRPVSERLAALREMLDAGADPNCIDIDKAAQGGESLLGRAFSVDRNSVDMKIVQELLDRGANPLRGNMWCEEVGTMEPLFNEIAFIAWANAPQVHNPRSSNVVQESTIGSHVMSAILKACKDHGHTNELGHDVICHMLHSIRPFSHIHFSAPLRQAMIMGFPINQSVGSEPSAVHFLLHKYIRSIHHGGVVLPFNATWNFISDFIEAGVDMTQRDATGRTAWEIIDQLEMQVPSVAAYDKILSMRQCTVLDTQTHGVPLSRRSNRL